MRTLILEPVDNGIIKTVYDDNINGAEKEFEEKKIYILEDKVENTEKFLLSLIEDLGLYTGNPHDKYNINVQKTFGARYLPTTNEVQEERKRIIVRLNELKRIAQYTSNEICVEADGRPE